MKKTLLTLIFFLVPFFATTISAQEDCPYPIIFLHGFTGSQDSWAPPFADANFTSIWGGATDTFFAVLNANLGTNIAGADNILGNNDDDVLFQFVNETNVLAPGCLYFSDWNNFWNEDENNPVVGKNPGDPIDECADPSGFFGSDSDGNESAFYKQGYAVAEMIDRVLTANPKKDKVILIGHSAGGCLIREYLQRTDAPTPSGKWWHGPTHRVAKGITVGSPLLGSNFFGNPFPKPGTSETEFEYKDGTPDINSELARDLRRSTALSSLACSFGFADNQGVYLYGGDEYCISDGYHNDDVNCDGDETDIITGVNIDGISQGFGLIQDGTYDNPAMPLPTDVRYVWLTHDIGTGGDLVVSTDRQWLFDNNNTPLPLDPGAPGAYYLADTLLGDYGHLNQTDDIERIVRSLDEGDYPRYAFDISPNIVYNGTATIRSTQVSNTSQPNPTDDIDWYKLTVQTNSLDTVIVNPQPNLSGSVDVYTSNPTDFETASAAISVPFSVGGAAIEIPFCNTTGIVNYWLRITHNGVGQNDWQIPYSYTVSSNTAFLDLNTNNIPDQCEPVSVALKVFLEGPFDALSGTMLLGMNQNNLLPLNTVYDSFPYDANTVGLTSIPANMVDWIMVEVRSGMDNTTTIETTSALLMSDGSIKDLDGVSDLIFNLDPNQSYYFVVRHRNHLDIMTAVPVLRSVFMNYDFTTGVAQAMGTAQQKLVGTAATMFSGDATQDMSIQTTDYDLWQLDPAILNEYELTDFNMDGTVQASDYDIWFFNKAKLGHPLLAY